MNRRTWMACLGLLVAAGMGSTQPPPASGIPEVLGVPMVPTEPAPPGVPMVPTEPAPPGVPMVPTATGVPGGPMVPTELAAPAAPVAPVAKPVAVVGDVEIGMTELESLLKQSDPVPVHLSERQQTQERIRALGMLIDRVLMRKFLETNAPPVDPAAVQRRLAEMEAALRMQDKSLAEFCQETRKTVDQVKADIADHLRWSAYEKEKLTDLELMPYYTANKDFFDGVTVRVSHIVVRVPSTATQSEKDAAREKLEGLRKQLLNDPKIDFDELARSQPDKGGDLGSIPRKWFDEKFSRVAFALPKGQISDIVQTDFGLHLIKVTERQPGKASEYAKIREAVRELRAQDLRQEILAQQRKKIEVKVNLP